MLSCISAPLAHVLSIGREDLLHAELDDLCEDTVNGATAVQVQPYVGDTGVHPLLVLLPASSFATDMPLVLYVDIAHAVVSSILHKQLYVKHNARWKTPANIGQGTPPAMEPLFEAMRKVLRRNPSFAVGVASDTFHYQQASITASAVLQLRQCNGYLKAVDPVCVCRRHWLLAVLLTAQSMWIFARQRALPKEVACNCSEISAPCETCCATQNRTTRRPHSELPFHFLSLRELVVGGCF